ncbi:MAG: hypothetical protein KKE30_14380 [Gammaproteobacteria bacterium]|nr:hypothetical protein [Gammaproteobacteria bacterium]MBU1554505.1 hypothetical protein [Gammaproteobacteria bacterium]MBU2071964.1 hypothetical protein [Gammaproteobacteria bacterium]MBU2181825.1 hypothetical protein [Gammaproteobacteria bacterium]MBU2204326.1 hypothetical protein [Gammaproteobacteria bacterium]
MSAFNICLKPSRWYQAGLLLLAVLPVLIMALTPAPWPVLLLLAALCLWFYSSWYARFQASHATAQLTLQQDRLHWFVPALGSATLCQGGVVSQHMLKLCWRQDNSQHPAQLWVFADQCSDSEFRALARAVNQCNWPGGC